MRVVLLGPPGAGKGTQADRIADRFQLVHVATGDILRANVADGTPLGEVAQAYLDSGELVPDEVVVAMMLERLTRPDCAHGFLLDGFPRSVAQARALDEHLAGLGTPLDAAINFFVSYTSADQAWAEWIAWQLEAEGYQVVIQAWDFRPGRDFVQQMHQVVEEAQRTVAVLSPLTSTPPSEARSGGLCLPRIRPASMACCCRSGRG